MATPDIETIAQDLAIGVEALLVKVRDQHQEILKWRKKFQSQEGEAVVDHEKPKDLQTDSITLGALSNPSDHVLTQPFKLRKADGLTDDPKITKAIAACGSLKSRREGTSEGALREQVRSCPITHRNTTHENFEHDFTTPGVQGTLGCPFAKMTTPAFPHTPDSAADPLAAEFHGDKVSVHSGSHQLPKCPIRFLEQHSPEEMAQYFEKHKHEIPRSHAICVKRYQQNEASIRELDAKYGNLVSMLQGLGVKHKAYLPPKNDDDVPDAAPLDYVARSTSIQAVGEWAKSVDKESNVLEQPLPVLDPVVEPLLRQGRRRSSGEKELKEVRVGESPTRPWGIPVPVDQQVAASVEEDTSGSSSPKGTGDMAYNLGDAMGRKASGGVRVRKTGANGVPKGAAARESSLKLGDYTTTTTTRDTTTKATPSIVFNGPVLIGYSQEDAVAFLETLKRL